MVNTSAVVEADGTEQPGVDPSDAFMFIIDDDICTRCAQVRRRWELETHSRRVFILQMSERCIRSAFTAEAYRACKRKERQATFALRLEGLEHINALRTHYGLALLLDPQLDLRSPQFTVQPIKKAAPSGAATA